MNSAYLNLSLTTAYRNQRIGECILNDLAYLKKRIEEKDADFADEHLVIKGLLPTVKTQLPTLQYVLEREKEERTLPKEKFSAMLCEDYATKNAKQLELLEETYWSFRTAIAQRIEIIDAFLKNRKSLEIGQEDQLPQGAMALWIVDILIDRCYSILGRRLKKGSFAELILNSLPRPIAYFDKLASQYPLQREGIILSSGIGLPFSLLNDPWLSISVIHEIAHDFDRKFALSAYYLRNVANKKFTKYLPHVSSDIKRIWLDWLPEILADAMGILFLGPAYVYSLLEMLFQTKKTQIIAADDGKHPQAYIRGLLNIEMLKVILPPVQNDELQKDIIALQQLWIKNTFIPNIETVHVRLSNKEYAVEEITAPMKKLVRWVMTSKLRIFNEKVDDQYRPLSLRDLIDPDADTADTAHFRMKDQLERLLRETFKEQKDFKEKRRRMIKSLFSSKDAGSLIILKAPLYIIAATETTKVKLISEMHDRQEGTCQDIPLGEIDNIIRNTQFLLCLLESQYLKEQSSEASPKNPLQLVEDLQSAARDEDIGPILQKMATFLCSSALTVENSGEPAENTSSSSQVYPPR